MTEIMSKWDGKGDLNNDISQVTLFAAYMKELKTKRGLVEFAFDKNFKIENLISM